MELGVPQARLEDVGSGLAPVSPGWFVVNVGEAAWVTSEAWGARCLFEADAPVLRYRPDLAPDRFPQLGFKLAVFEPGRPWSLPRRLRRRGLPRSARRVHRADRRHGETPTDMGLLSLRIRNPPRLHWCRRWP